METRRILCDFYAEHLHTLKRLACPLINTAFATTQHRSASFYESMSWFMFTLDIFAVRYSSISALRRAAKVHCVIKFSALAGTIQAEQPRATDAAMA
jgi:hypothetical protein